MWLTIGIVFCALIAQIFAEQCITPNNEQGECISLYSCPILIGALASQQRVSIEFVSESNCGGTAKNPMVCCGTLSNFTADKDSTGILSKNASKLSLLPTSRYCGLQHADDYYRAMNDTSIRITEFPWLARIKFRPRDSSVTLNTIFFCIGSLINRRYVLTAAHCVVRTRTRIPESVHLGEFNVRNQTDCVQEPQFEEECSDQVEDVGIENIILHPNYSRRHTFNDIALIRLRKDMFYSDYIRPICLPFSERTTAKAGDTLLSTGWGKGHANADYVEIKKKILSKLITNIECKKIYNTFQVKIGDNQLCAVSFSNNTNVECEGDSGGPLMFSHNGQWHQEGIISFGATRCGEDFPDVYTKVMNYLDWILEVIKP